VLLIFFLSLLFFPIISFKLPRRFCEDFEKEEEEEEEEEKEKRKSMGRCMCVPRLKINHQVSDHTVGG